MNRLFVMASVLAASVLTMGSVAFAADEKPDQFVVCKSAKAVRTLSVMPETKTGASTASCKVTYTKGGVAETVGEHTNKSNCKSILAHVQTQLENSKWNCRNVSTATTTTSAEVSRQ